MTLPKTHPLHGAIDTLVAALSFLGIGGNETEAREIAEGFIKDLEAAGYRVVGPEITQEMEATAHTSIACGFVLPQVLRETISAAPTITETEKSGE